MKCFLPNDLDVLSVKKNEHPIELCANPDGFDKSSQAMESMGSVKTVLDLWNNCSTAYVSAIVTDEDSTTRSKLSHSMAELVEAGKMSEPERRYKPKIAGNLGKKKRGSWRATDGASFNLQIVRPDTFHQELQERTV